MNAITLPSKNFDQLAVSRLVRSNLPFLRRFGRALTGHQHLADLCVIQIMNDVLDLPYTLSNSANPRVVLYRRLLALLAEQAKEAAFKPGEAEIFLSPLSRQVQLLVNVEGFKRAEAAEIARITVEEIDRLLQTARGAAARGAGVLIIEDEPLISMQIESLSRQLGHEIVGIATTRAQANRAVRSCRPDLILSDVQLADGSSGIDAVSDILSSDPIPVIYITAYPERLLTGRRVEPIFLISKPFDAEAVKATIGQALFLDSQLLS